MTLRDAQRILVIGIPGAGKSTLAKQIGHCLELPVIHLDQQFWRPGWEMTPNDEWELRVQELCAKPRWVIDGNFSGSLELRLKKADAVVYLDFNRVTALYRVGKRVFRTRGRVRPDMAPECPERFDWSFVKYIWRFPATHRRVNETILRRHGNGKPLYRLRSQRAIDAFVRKQGLTEPW